jgi:hypothetical protein
MSILRLPQLAQHQRQQHGASKPLPVAGIADYFGAQHKLPEWLGIGAS